MFEWTQICKDRRAARSLLNRTILDLAFFPTSPPLAKALAERNYNEPTPVQALVVEPEALGRDILVSAQTGSGKTVAYGLAIGFRLLGETELLPQAAEPLALIIAPTRELALQVERELEWLYRYANARVTACVGGMEPRRERRKLSEGVHIVVGTPGRLRDHIERGDLNVTKLRAVVLDEADEMLDLGFRKDLEFILEATPPERQTLLFSATLPKTIAGLAKRYQRDAMRITVAAAEGGHADIEYRAIRVAPHDVEHAVVNVLRFFESPSAIIFCNTRDAVRHLQAILLERGFSVVALSGELSQSERNQALQLLRDGRARVCVATDVAARGIDLPNLALVIHADLPNDAESLQHRSGRTGRAGRKGVSVLLVPPSRRRLAENLLNAANVQPVWSGPPMAEEIRKLDQDRLFVDPLLTEENSEEELAMGKALLAQRPAEDIAAALVRVYRSRLPAPEELLDPGPGREMREPRPPKRLGDRVKSERFGERAKPERYTERADATAPRGRAPAAAYSGQGKGIWFRLDIGRKNNADPKWLLPMLCNRGRITRQDIGAIRIFDTETKFEVAPEAAEQFSQHVKSSGGADGHITPLNGAPERNPAENSAAERAPRQRTAPNPSARQTLSLSKTERKKRTQE